MLALLAAALLAVAPPPSAEVATADTAVAEARAHLQAGRIDEVLFSLQGVKPEGELKALAAAVLAEAGAHALGARDDFMALQLAQMALGHDPALPRALEVAARASLAQEQFGSSEEYADRWVRAAPSDAHARLFRAQLAHGQGESQAALDVLAEVDAASLPAGQGGEVERIRREATARLKEHAQSRAELSKMEADLERAAEGAKRARPVSGAGFGFGDEARVASGGKGGTAGKGGVILYRTTWCGYCTQARAFLKRKGVAFVEKDVERDPAAAKELAEKRARAGIRSGGVPVIDVRGSLVLGFDKARLEQLLD